ncbi:MAG: Hpt domain-containing protein [Myxococcota bacterium]|jgi:HPt (histidine-containing phosphotransfer) domain-containing protein|nr:Hpt domain-containing protein [Myxococcota bacterium]
MSKLNGIPAFLIPLLPDFVALRRGDLQEARTALDKSDWDQLRRVGHLFKGSGGSYGLNALSTWGARLEALAKHQDAVSITTLLADLDGYLQELEVELQDTAAG